MTLAHEHAAKQAEMRADDADVPGVRVKPRLHRVFVNRLADLELDNRDAKTVTRNRQSFERFEAWLRAHGVDAADVTETYLRRYFKDLPTLVSARTAETEAQHVKSAYQFAAEDGLIARSPVTRRVRVPKATVPEPDPYTADELRRIRAAVKDDFEECLFFLLVYSGLRRHEIVQTRREAVDFEQRIMAVTGKGGKLRRVPIHPRLARVLRRYFERHDADALLGRGGSMRNVNDRIGRLLKRAGVDGGNRPAHRFRKTAATSLRREGVHGDVIDRIFGWSPLTIRQRFYAGVDDDELHDAIVRLYASDPIERPAHARTDVDDIQQRVATLR